MAIEQVVCGTCNGHGAFTRGPYPATKCNSCGGKGYYVRSLPEPSPVVAMPELRWEGDECFAGGILVGWIARWSTEKVNAVLSTGKIGTVIAKHLPEPEARTAVEAAICERLGSKP